MKEDHILSLACPRCGHLSPESAGICQNVLPDGNACATSLGTPSGRLSLVSVHLSSASPQVHPSETLELQARIHNSGPDLDHVELDVIGEGKDWAAVEPRQLALAADAEVTARITFLPPPTAEHGKISFAFSARFGHHPYEASWARGTIDIVSRLRLRAEVRPRESRGRFSGASELLITNLDATPQAVTMETLDPQAEVTVRARKPTLIIEPCAQVRTKLRIRPRHRLWWRQPQTPLPFRLQVSPEGDLDPVTAEGELLRLPVFPVSKRIGIALGLLLGTAAIAVSAWSVAHG